MRLYVGIDPGFVKTGVVVLDQEGALLAAGVIKLPAEGRSDLDRAIAIATEAQAMVEDSAASAHVTMVAIEGYSIESRFRVAMLATLGTVLRLRLRALLWPYVEPAPTQLKNYALMANRKWKGKAKAKPVAEVEKLWGFKHKSTDVIDAYVLAQIARAAGGAHPLAALDPRQIDVVAKLKACS